MCGQPRRCCAVCAELLCRTTFGAGLLPAGLHCFDPVEAVPVQQQQTSAARADTTWFGCCCRWTPSQALPSPLNPGSFTPLSAPKPVWHIPLADVAADRSAVQHLDFELTASGEQWLRV